jgi:hypothetical protein
VRPTMLSALIALTALPAFAAPSPASGTWRQASTPAEVQASIDAGVAASVAPFPRMFHGVARSRLAGLPTVCARYAFRVNDAEVAWRCDDRPELVVPASGLGVPFTIQHDGKPVKTTVTREGDVVRARFASDEGYRVNVFTFRGERLVLEASIHGDKLEVPLRWSVTYARDAAASPPTTP